MAEGHRPGAAEIRSLLVQRPDMAEERRRAPVRVRRFLPEATPRVESLSRRARSQLRWHVDRTALRHP
jgi:hypothetical protein